MYKWVKQTVMSHAGGIYEGEMASNFLTLNYVYLPDLALNSHDLIVRHTILALVSRLLVHLMISQDFTEILLICAKISIYCVT